MSTPPVHALGAALAVVTTAAVLALGANRPGRPSRRRAAPAPGARWARSRDLRPLRAKGRGHLRLGALSAPGRRRLIVRTERAQSLAVVGPTQSGKTSSLAVPAILEWEGPVLAASVKTDLLADTERWRRGLGTVWCFDPAGATGRRSAPWSPLT